MPFCLKWIVVGPSVCGGVGYGIRPVVAALPSWFRFAQCLRRYRDTRLAFPHLVNAGKYATTFFVVIFSTLHSIYKGTVCFLRGLQSSSTCPQVSLPQADTYRSPNPKPNISPNSNPC